MRKRTVGIIFILISALLISARYIASSILSLAVSNNLGKVRTLQDGVLEETAVLGYFSLITLILGAMYLVWGEVELFLKEKRVDN